MQKIPEIFQRTDKDPAYKKVPVDPVYVFRGLRFSDPVDIPELAENRQCTDVILLMIFIIASLSLVISSAYIATNSDIRITINGKDKCGNVCGMKNTVLYSDSCSPLDYTNNPILLVSEKKCVSEDECKAKDMVVFFGRCFLLNSTEQEINLNPQFWKSVEKWNPYTIIACAVPPVIASVLAVLVFYLFHHQTKCAVNTFGTMSVLILIALACYFWYQFSQKLKQYGIRKSTTILYLCSCIITTLGVIGITCVFCCFRDKIKFLLRLYRETLDAIFNSKRLLFVPILGVAILVLLTFCWIYMILATISISVPQDSAYPVARIIYLVFLVFMGFWIFNFSNACHCMTVAGTVASYYFASDKANLPSQYFKNLGIVFRFHLGTVATGSLIITIVNVTKIIMEHLLFEAEEDADEDDASALNILSCLGTCIASCIEGLVNYINTKAYIITAFHGKSFCTSGKRAMQLIWTNFLDIVSIDILNATVLISAAVLIQFFSLLIPFAIIWKEDSKFIWINLGLGLFLVCQTIYLFFLTLNISLATIFLCYCEDLSMNDGSRQRPYYTRPELQDAINDAFAEEAEEEEKRKKSIFGR